MSEKYLLIALMPQLAFWMLVAFLAMRETRILRRRVRELEAELETRKAGK